MLESDWLAPHHPIPNAKFPPITALLNRSTYYNSAKGFLTTLSPVLTGSQKSMKRLTINESAKKQKFYKTINGTIRSECPSGKR